MENKFCPYCFNARVALKLDTEQHTCQPPPEYDDNELTDNNDFSSCGLTDGTWASRGIKLNLMLNAGNGKPVNIECNYWDNISEMWVPIMTYNPKYCPECGRDLSEDGYNEDT